MAASHTATSYQLVNNKILRDQFIDLALQEKPA